MRFRKFIGMGLLCLFLTSFAHAQQLKLGTGTSNMLKSAVLELNSSRQGLLMPRISDTSLINTLNPPDGMVIFFTPTKQLYIRSNGAWKTYLQTTNDYFDMASRSSLGLVQAYTDYNDPNEQLIHLKSAVQFYAPAAQFYKPKIYVDANGNFRTKGSAAGTDFFEFGATGTNNDGGFEFIVGDDGNEPIVFKSYNYLTATTSEMMRLQSGRMAIGSNSFDANFPEKLLVDAGATTSYNLMTGKGSINNYLQINIQNQSGGTQASSDIVATANNGTESSNYIDMGINSGGFTNTTYPIISGANTAYLYSTGNDFSIGNATSGKYLRFFTGGYASTNERLTIDGTGNVGVATATPAAKLDAAGTYKLGTKGSVNKNSISFVYTVPSNFSIPAATSTGSGTVNIVLLGSYAINTTNTTAAGAYDMSVALVAANQPTSTQATVTVSPAFDLPANIAIAFSRATSTSALKIRFQNNGTTAQNITSGQQFYITITEF